MPEYNVNDYVCLKARCTANGMARKGSEAKITPNIGFNTAYVYPVAIVHEDDLDASDKSLEHYRPDTLHEERCYEIDSHIVCQVTDVLSDGQYEILCEMPITFEPDLVS